MKLEPIAKKSRDKNAHRAAGLIPPRDDGGGDDAADFSCWDDDDCSAICNRVMVMSLSNEREELAINEETRRGIPVHSSTW